MVRLDDLLATYGEVDMPLEDTSSVVFTGVTIDSRQCPQGGLFVALPGEHHDGHSFVEEALERGCRGALGCADRLPPVRHSTLAARVYTWNGQEWILSGTEGAPTVLILVPDPLEVLQRLAARWRSCFSPVVVGITGSVGKSSTKELLAAVLSKRYITLKNPKSYNNEIGLPLTLLELRPEHQVIVLEMGTYGPGEITLLTEMARPQIGVVTNVSHSHLERMMTLETIARAKSELPAALPPEGLAILNGDEAAIRSMAGVTEATVLFYGLQEGSQLRASEVQSCGLAGISFSVQAEGEHRQLRCCLPGRHSVYTALAAVAVGRHLGMNWDEIEAGLLDPSARLRLLYAPGVGGATLIDDTYNASPVSCRAALDLLTELPGCKIAVFGDMMELGAYEEEGHRLVGEWAAGVVDELFVQGERARWIGEGALAQGMPASHVHFAGSHEQVVAMLVDHLESDDIVLVKGSRSMEMERIIIALRQEEI